MTEKELKQLLSEKSISHQIWTNPSLDKEEISHFIDNYGEHQTLHFYCVLKSTRNVHYRLNTEVMLPLLHNYVILYITEEKVDQPVLKKNKKQTIYNLKLHETLLIDMFTQVQRVPSGWLYHTKKATTFVPFSIKIQ
jgi:hypothetical protein